MNTGQTAFFDIINPNLGNPVLGGAENDFVIRTDNSNQKIFLATGSNVSPAACFAGSNVGIGGNSNPQFSLDVRGNVNFTGSLFQNGSRYIGSQWTTSSNSNAISITQCNVGIGTSNPQFPLDVAGSINFTGDLFQNNQRYIGSQWTTASTSNSISIVNSNVGIGTTTPQQLLHIAGTTRIDGGIVMQNQQMSITRIKVLQTQQAGSIANITSVVNQVSGINSISTTNFDFSLSNPQAAFRFLDSAGNVESTINSTGDMNIVGSFSTNSTVRITANGTMCNVTLSNPRNISIDTSAITTGILGVANGGTGANTLAANKLLVGNGINAVLQPTGLHWDATNSRLGINTTSPTFPLEIASSNLAYIRVASTNNATNANIELATISGSHTIYRHATTNSLRFFNGTTDVMTLSNANVGIGTLTPNYKLHVDGDIYSTGNQLAPNRPAFFAFSGGGQVATASGATLAFNATRYNVGSHYSTSSFQFTAPIAGLYAFAYCVQFHINGSANIIGVALRVNNSDVAHTVGSKGGGWFNAQGTYYLYLNANDKVNPVPYNFDGGSIIIEYTSGTPRSFFTGYLIG